MKIFEDLEKLVQTTVKLNKPTEEDRRIMNQEKLRLTGRGTDQGE